MRYRAADGNAVEFYEKPIPHRAMSNGSGRPIFWKRLMARLQGPGMRDTQEVEIALYDDQGGLQKKYPWRFDVNTGEQMTQEQRFAAPLKAWRDSNGEIGNGTPLESWPRINDVAILASLKAAGIHFLESLAEVPDGNLDKIGPHGRQLRDGARAFILAAEGNAPIDKLSAENADLSDQLKAQAQQIAELTAQLSALTAPPQQKGK